MVKREGIKLIAEFAPDTVVGIIKWRGKIVIATRTGVYIYPPDKKKETKHES